METALILLKQWDQWEKVFSDGTVTCLKVGREARTVLTVEQARNRAARRFRASERTSRRVQKHVNESKQETLRLSFDDDEE